MTISVRLDAKTERMLARLARVTGRTRSAVIRDAIRRLGEQADGSASASTAYARFADAIGIVDLGPWDRAARTEEILRARFASRRVTR